MLSITGDVELGNIESVDLDRSRKRIVEFLDELNESTLPASRRTDNRDELTGLDLEVKSTKYADVGASRVAEVDVVERNLTSRFRELETAWIVIVDFGDSVEKFNDCSSGTTSGRHILSNFVDLAFLL